MTMSMFFCPQCQWQCQCLLKIIDLSQCQWQCQWFQNHQFNVNSQCQCLQKVNVNGNLNYIAHVCLLPHTGSKGSKVSCLNLACKRPLDQHMVPSGTGIKWNWSGTFRCPSLFVRSSVCEISWNTQKRLRKIPNPKQCSNPSSSLHIWYGGI